MGKVVAHKSCHLVRRLWLFLFRKRADIPHRISAGLIWKGRRQGGPTGRRERSPERAHRPQPQTPKRVIQDSLPRLVIEWFERADDRGDRVELGILVASGVVYCHDAPQARRIRHHQELPTRSQ